MSKRKPTPTATTTPTPPVTVLCPDCGGRGWRAVGTDEVPCSRCVGTGKAKA